MNSYDPIGLLFGGMEKLGPGSNSDTLHVLKLLPKQSFRLVVDAGCGTGRQTMVLAKSLGSVVHAVDTYKPFLDDLVSRAQKAGVDHLVRTHCMDMKDIPTEFKDIDLLWSEGAAYSIGFSNALSTWAAVIISGGFAVVSEMSWLENKIPDKVREFFLTVYPDMQTIRQNIEIAENAGYKVLTTHMLPKETWVEGYYDILEPRAKFLVDHPDPAVRAFAIEAVKEIEVFECSEDSYGYVIYVLQRV